MSVAVPLTKMSSFSFRKGDMVWVRSSPSSSWEPALFLRKESDDTHLVLLFSLNPPKYFSLPNICPFDENFRTHFTKADPRLVNDALIYFTHRLGFSLECRCSNKGKRKKMRKMNGAWNFDKSIAKERDLFDPSQVLRFACRLAARPWFEDGDVVCVTRGIEQVKAFRSWLSAEQLLRKWEEIVERIGDRQPENLTQGTSTFSSTSVEVAPLTPDVEDKSQGSYSVINQDTVYDGASDSSMSLEDNLESDVGSELVFDSVCHNHDKGGIHITDRKDAADCFLSMVRRSETVLYINNLQFLHLRLICIHNLAVDHFFLQGESLEALKCEVLKFRSWSKGNGNAVLLERFPSGRKLEYPSTSLGYDCGVKSQSADAAFHRMKRQLSHCHVFKPLKLQKTLFLGTDRSFPCRIASLSDKDLSDSSFLHSLSKHQVLSITEASLECTDLATGSVSEAEDRKCAMNKSSMSGNCNSVKKIKYKQPAADFKADPTDSLVVPFGVGSLLTTTIANRPDAVSIPTGCAGDKAIGNEVQTENLPVTSTFHKSLQVSKDGKTLHNSTSSNLSSVPKRVSKLHGDSTSLTMKFPNGFHLPSKDELVKKFTRFGPVDIMNSKVYSSSGSARVVFFKQIDAVAAYQYAKRSKVLGPAKIRFWLDPSEYGRKARKPQVQSSETHVMPCLRKPNSPENEARKKSRQVRFSL